jgi:hypothetical protein
MKLVSLHIYCLRDNQVAIDVLLLHDISYRMDMLRLELRYLGSCVESIFFR